MNFFFNFKRDGFYAVEKTPPKVMISFYPLSTILKGNILDTAPYNVVTYRAGDDCINNWQWSHKSYDIDMSLKYNILYSLKNAKCVVDSIFYIIILVNVAVY